jgi:oligopeptide transport system substrate-binding protein
MKHIRLLIVLVLFSCSSQDSLDVKMANAQGILLLDNGTEPQGLDPHIVTGVTEHKIVIALFEGLTMQNPTGEGVIPAAAESWQISEDGLKIVFNIRPDAKWSNGDSLTAQDFVYSWRRILTPTLGSRYPDMLYAVKNAEEFNKAQISDFDLVGVKALDFKTLEVTLKTKTPFFLKQLAHYATYPVHPSTIEAFGGISNRDSRWTRPENMISNGPFVLDEWSINKVIKVKRNDNYWDNKNLKLNGIHFFPIDNQSTSDRYYRSGKTHNLYTIQTEKIAKYKEEYPDQFKLEKYFGTYYYRINTDVVPLSDINVRKALSLAIDRDLIVNKVTKGGQKPAYSFTPPSDEYYDPPTKLNYDPDLAREYLSKAGYPNGQGFPEFELLYNTNEGHQKIAQAIQQFWLKELGIKITLTNVDWKVYLDRESQGQYQISRAGWIGDYVDPNSFLDMMVTDRGNNKTGWSNKQYDSYINKATFANDESERLKNFSKAEEILMDELPIIPIYTYTRVYMLRDEVKGWYPNLLDTHPYQFISLED